MNREAELESQVRQLEQRNAATADELRCSRDREKALREQRDSSEARVAALEGALREARLQFDSIHTRASKTTPPYHLGLQAMGARDRIDEALAAAVPPKSPDVELYEAQERFVDARRAAAVPQPPEDAEPLVVSLLGELDAIVSSWLRVESDGSDPDTDCVADIREVVARFRKLVGPAVPQPPREMVDEAVETRAREAMIEPTSANKLSGRWESPDAPQGESPSAREPHPAGWACNSCNPERGIRCALHKVEPTPAPQGEIDGFGNPRCVAPDCGGACLDKLDGEPTPSDDSHFHTERPWPGYIVRWSDSHGDFWVDFDGMPSCFATHEEAVRACDEHRALVREAPPAGEPSPDPWELLRRCVKYAREDRMVTPRFTRLQRVLDEAERALAAQPAPASPPRDESPLPPQWKKREWHEGWMYRGPGEDQHVFVGKDDSVTAADTNATAMLAVLAHHFGAPTVSREVDEAAVRASVGEAMKRWNDWHPDDGFGCDKFALLVDSMNALAKAYRTTERPAASGKEQGE